MPAVNSKKVRAQVLLASKGAPRVLSPATLRDFLSAAGCDIPQRTLTQAIWEWTQSGVLDKVSARVYLNLSAVPRPRPDEAACWLRTPMTVISSTRVLGDAGVLNNPSRWVTAVMPVERSRRSGVLAGPRHTFVFSALPQSMLPDPGTPGAEDCYDIDAPYLRATPEKAIVDAVYLARHTGQSPARQLPPAHDWDWGMVDIERLERLLQRFEMGSAWEAQRQHIGGPEFRSDTAVKKRKP